MKRLDLQNPFGAPVYHEERVSSTMEAARSLAAGGAPHGTVIAADFQESGRGRQGRPWKAEKGQNLMFSILLDYRDFSRLPAALTLKTGLAVSLAIEDFVPLLAGSVQVKWPNDVMLPAGPGMDGKARKAVGILAEAEGAKVYIGIGVNLAQRRFPEELRDKAGSLLLALEERFPLGEVADSVNQDSANQNSVDFLLSPDAPFQLLEKILHRLYRELEDSQDTALSWKARLEARLYRRGEKVRFAPGAAGSTNLIQGRLAGIGEGGELLILPEGEEDPQAFIAGELRVY